jgi:hypothetical protein
LKFCCSAPWAYFNATCWLLWFLQAAKTSSFNSPPLPQVDVTYIYGSSYFCATVLVRPACLYQQQSQKVMLPYAPSFTRSMSQRRVDFHQRSLQCMYLTPCLTGGPDAVITIAKGQAGECTTTFGEQAKTVYFPSPKNKTPSTPLGRRRDLDSHR